MKISRSSEVPWAQSIDRGKFQGRRKPLGGEKLLCGLWELPQGKRSFPLHFHHVTEEAIWVVSGDGPFVYVGMSALLGFDIVEYADSDKVAASIGAFPKSKRFVFRKRDQADYFDGED